MSSTAAATAVAPYVPGTPLCSGGQGRGVALPQGVCREAQRRCDHLCFAHCSGSEGRASGRRRVAPSTAFVRRTGASAYVVKLCGGNGDTQARVRDASAAGATARPGTFSERCLIIICIEHLGQRGALSRSGVEQPRFVVMKDTRAVVSPRG